VVKGTIQQSQHEAHLGLRLRRLALPVEMRPLPPNNSLQLTRLACGKLERVLPARMSENGATVARAAGQLSSRPFGGGSEPSIGGAPWRLTLSAKRYTIAP